MTRTLVLLVAMMATALVLAAPGAARPVKTVRLSGQSFSAPAIAIRKGGIVRFVWASGFHNVTRASGPKFKLISSRGSGTVARIFAVRGKYRLFCSIHGPAMHVTVTVR